MYHISEISNEEARSKHINRIREQQRASKAGTFAVQEALDRGYVLDAEDVADVLETATACAIRRNERLGSAHIKYALSFLYNL